SGGRAVIQGRFSAQEAEDLAVQLTSGPLPVPIEILEKRILAPEGEEERN
ncbi:MAG: hypothetical protein F6K35_38635, partial [Okeania sp. SIO2H7]|nr:hypothetical protein [Okeania sp. SIO2H7]